MNLINIEDTKKIKTNILLSLLSKRVNLDFIMREAVSMAKELEGGFEVAGKFHAPKQRGGRRSWAPVWRSWTEFSLQVIS